MRNENEQTGFDAVDEHPDTSFLLDAMDATGAWEATIELRAFEREHLRLQPGERLLDVGCGLGTAGLALAAALGADGELVGVDPSTTMLEVARQRGASASCTARYEQGDAMALDLPDSGFDAARSERCLQWVPDADGAVRELVRVLRPGGRLCLIDSDWSTFRLDIGDPELTAMVSTAYGVERDRPSNVGGRLAQLVRAAGCTVVAEHTVTHHYGSWDPDTDRAPAGCFPMEKLAEDLVDCGLLPAADADALTQRVFEAARRGSFAMSLAMHGVVATTPG